MAGGTNDVRRKTRGLSPQEQIAHFRRQAATGPLGKYWQALERRAKA